MAIKELFKGVTESVKSVTTKAVNKIDNTVDVQKLKYRISKKEEEINDVYKTLGETIVKAVYAEESFDEFIAEAIAKIEELKEELVAMNAERLAKSKNVECEDCGTEVDAKSEFCPKCGKHLAKTESEDEIN